ncbi:leucine-rich repeats and immunoglobulin-like domains protein 1 [Sabethes cyaneus]|uniref:leucine-rich repeats and immunoglobulin-like domains protein 1 n=1 Tax=Sabethes cyaneus TaxID=53552 RepID=UPI00237DCD76|nr:leucine-rich repeats and immunoglobulin-like domains protein 1 [Sabethes cyaneus]
MLRLILSVAIVLLAPQVLAISFCPNRCVCDDIKLHVTCGEGELDVLPIALNPAIQRLVIKFNQIKAIDSSIQFYTDLTMLDLSYNHLLGVPERIFVYQRRLLQLHLNNNKVSTINNKTFHGLEELRVLNLRANFLDELNAAMFKSLPKLEELNLSQNRIGKIDAQTFEGLTSLRILHLNDNALSMISAPTFQPLRMLAELFLGTNLLNQIQPGVFQGLNKLRKLNVRGSMLVNITVETFRGVENIRSLDISDNHLLHVPTVQLSMLKRLEELVIGQNDFQFIPEGAFFGLVNLRKIDISGALNLMRIQAGAFSANTNLDTIVIASNKILEDIEEGAFSGLPHIENVVLRDNAIRSVREELLPWKQLKNFDLSENPLICNCHLRWLRNLLRQKSIETEQSTILCEYPERLNGEALREINSELLGCHLHQSKERAVFGVTLVATAASLTTLILVAYRLRNRLIDFMGPNWHNKRNALKEEKDLEFGKCFEEIDYHQPNFNIYSYQYRHSFPQHVPDMSQQHDSFQHHIYETPIPVSDL